MQPLKGDWRSMIRRKEKKRAVQEPKKKSTSESLEDTSNGLPGGWKALVDEVSGEVYYGNVDTMVSVSVNIERDACSYREAVCN